MKLRTFLASGLAAAAALALSSAPAMAQTPAKYKSEYRMSLVLGTALPWGPGGDMWATMVR